MQECFGAFVTTIPAESFFLQNSLLTHIKKGVFVYPAEDSDKIVALDKRKGMFVTRDSRGYPVQQQKFSIHTFCPFIYK